MSLFDRFPRDFFIPFPCAHQGCKRRATIGITCSEHFREALLVQQRDRIKGLFYFSDEEIDEHADAICAHLESIFSKEVGATPFDVMTTYPKYAALLRERWKLEKEPVDKIKPITVQLPKGAIALNGVEKPDGTVLVRSFDFVDGGAETYRLPQVPSHVPTLLASEIVSVQPMTEQRPEFAIHVMSPEEIAEAAKHAFTCDAFTVANCDGEPWSKGRLRMSRKDNGTWSFGFWRDAEPLCGCIPSEEGTITGWLTPRPGLYAPVPEGHTMVAFNVAPAASHTKVAFVVLIPSDREVELREKVQPPAPPDPGPEYGG